MRIFVICLLSIALTGCQQMAQQRRNEAGQIMMTEISVCKNGELTRKNVLQRADCIANARRKFGAAIDASYFWVLEQNLAADRESAIAYSKGKISKEEFQTEVQRHYADGAATEAQAMQQGRQQNMQSLMAIQGMLPKPQPAPQPYMMPTNNKPIQTNCNGIGNSINCTSY